MKLDNVEKYDFLKDEPKTRQFELYDLAAYFDSNSNHSSHPHTHSFYQLIWFKNETGKHYVDFQEFDIKKDRIFFISKNQVHYFENRTDYEGYLIHFNESFILSNEKDINFFLTYSIFNNPSEPFFQVPHQLQHQFLDFLKQINTESSNRDEFGNDSILSHLLRSFFLLVEREKRRHIGSDQQKQSQSTTYLHFLDLLENNFHQNWSVADFSEKLSVSSKTLNSLLKRETGKTVSQAIVDRIILESKRKLTHSSAQIKQIAYDLGFSDPYYFNKFFKKHVKCSPTKFRATIS